MSLDAYWMPFTGIYVRLGGGTLQLAPPFIVERSEIDRLVETIRESLQEVE